MNKATEAKIASTKGSVKQAKAMAEELIKLCSWEEVRLVDPSN